MQWNPFTTLQRALWIGGGQWAGKKPSGVTDANQAANLTKAYGCLANDPYVTQALWFTLRDTTTESVDELNHYGLVLADPEHRAQLSKMMREFLNLPEG